MNDFALNLAVEEAHQILKQFDCLAANSLEPLDRDRLRQALLKVASQSDYQMLGICSANFAQGFQALQQYAQALGYEVNSALEAIEGATYIKFNPKLGSCYAAVYLGEYRGVLISCQSADTAGVNEMYGHLPLDLFAH